MHYNTHTQTLTLIHPEDNNKKELLWWDYIFNVYLENFWVITY